MVQIDATMILAWLNFLVLLLLLTKLLYRPMLDFLDKRAAKIEGSLQQARKAAEESQAVLEEYRKRLAGARREAAGILESARNRAEEESKAILARAKIEADRIAARAKEELDREVAHAREQLRREVGRLSVQVAESILRRELSPEDHQRYVEEYLQEMGGRN